MKTLKNAYDYLFYTFYRFWESAPSKWWSDWKAVVTICVLTGYGLFSVLGLITYYIKVDIIASNMIAFIIFPILIYGLNYYYFLWKDKWKERISRFQNLSKSKDRIGIFLTILLTALIAIFFVYSLYLISTVDWQSLE